MSSERLLSGLPNERSSVFDLYIIGNFSDFRSNLTILNVVLVPVDTEEIDDVLFNWERLFFFFFGDVKEYLYKTGTYFSFKCLYGSLS